jgi:hypothetical protein
MLAFMLRLYFNFEKDWMQISLKINTHGWMICGHLSGGSAASYLFQMRIRLTQPSKVELGLGLRLAKMHGMYFRQEELPPKHCVKATPRATQFSYVILESNPNKLDHQRKCILYFNLLQIS